MKLTAKKVNVPVPERNWIYAVISVLMLLMIVLWIRSAVGDSKDTIPPSNDKNKTENAGSGNTQLNTKDTAFIGTTPCSPDISYKFDIHVTAPVYIKYTGASEAVYCEEGDDVKPPAGSKAGPVTITAATKKQAEIVVIRKN